METKFQTSFIPKRSFGSNEVYTYKSPLGIFLIISICIAGISVLLAGGYTLYKVFLNRDLQAKETEIEQREAELGDGEIDELVRFSDKLSTGKKLLDSHIAVSPIFTLLENTTLKRLRFTDLTYTYLGANKVAVAMKGEAKDFGVVASQSDEFAKVSGANFTNPIFSNLNTTDKGNVTFSFLTSVDQSLVSYKKNMSASSDTSTSNAPSSVASTSSATTTKR